MNGAAAYAGSHDGRPMKFTYGQAGDGELFRTPDELFASPSKLMEFILQHGDDGLEALDESERADELIEQLIEAGMLERDEGGQLRPTPRLVKGMQIRALAEVFRGVRAGVKDGHESPDVGQRGERADGTRAYRFGDSIADVDLPGTLRAAATRSGARGGGGGEGGSLLPIELDERDIAVFNTESTADTATAVLIDLSGSMARFGRHVAAKRVALAMQRLIRERFPGDTLDFVGFASVAEVVKERDVALLMPRPVTTRAWNVKIRVPLSQAAQTHPHFTNLHHALRVARRTLARRSAPNKQVFIITDGCPTAHLSGGPGGIGEAGDEPILNLIYPPQEASALATLEEAHACVRAGVRIATFALIDDYEAMDWVGFVERLTRVTRGVGLYCTAGDLAGMIVESYLTGKRSRRRG